MLTPFLKMHGCGNDFVVFDGRDEPYAFTPELVAALADRRTGIGCDQFIVLERAPRGTKAAAFMRIWNPDGSEAGACGNATRCVAGLVAREAGKRKVAIATVSGVLPATLRGDGEVEVDMGAPGLGWRDVPLAEERDTLRLVLGPHPNPLPEGEGVEEPSPSGRGLGEGAALSMGNPHVTFFVPDLDAVDIERLGPVIENDRLFPDRVNVGFAQMLAPDRILLSVWERGAGQTLACGSAACAALVNAHRRGLAGREAVIDLPGGEIEIAWRAKDGHVLMTGPTETVFTGVIDLPE